MKSCRKLLKENITSTFRVEVGNDTFLCKVGNNIHDYMAPQHRDHTQHLHCYENLRSQITRKCLNTLNKQEKK
jgi:hypothetical protein